MKNDEYYMSLALKEALKAQAIDEVPIGAIIVHNDKVIARAHNLRESKQMSINHAEVLAIQKACKKLNTWRLEGCTLYVTLEPCPMCAGAIMQSRIERVVFGASDFKGGSYGSNFNLNDVQGLNHYPIIEKGIMSDDAANLIKEFFRNKRLMKKQGK